MRTLAHVIILAKGTHTDTAQSGRGYYDDKFSFPFHLFVTSIYIITGPPSSSFVLRALPGWVYQLHFEREPRFYLRLLQGPRTELGKSACMEGNGYKKNRTVFKD